MIRVLVVDDQEMIRFGIRGMLEADPDIDVVAEAADGFHALDALASTSVDVILLDIRMPGIDGVETTKRIRQSWPSDTVKIVILTTFDNDRNVVLALQAGANGFLSKGVSPSDLTNGVKEVAAGGGALSPTATAALIGHVSDSPRTTIDAGVADRFAALTSRERAVVTSMVAGLDKDEIAVALSLSPFTVKTHINRAMSKVGARDRAQLMTLAFRAGITPE
ncbi:LuxR family two component transcriptional regulator [Frondihabitans sp. PhB188]|uniref:response regulator transcription factor n=1 Tax=Frondihabitans sp. PhB188 TaxID=2485200 RepID=UPI000F492602|nr:response regulator transcription factor [Frondihabitans sp. PhB188]ROQ31052.1 LuxR family two component transcriptional regulator [Frondihabitans sp. PhB188]